MFRIIIPSILFSIIEFIPSCLIQGRGIDMGYALYKTVGGGTYWFTSALVVAELVLLLLLCSRKRNVWFYTVACLLLGMISLVIVKCNLVNNNIWMWRHGLIALIFLAMGGLYKTYESQIDKLMKWPFVIPLSAVYVAMVLGLKGYNNPLISTLSIQPLGFVTSAIACILLVWFCKILPAFKPLTFIGQNSLGFYFLSGALPISFSLVARKLVIGNHVWIMLLVWLVCMVVAYVAVMVINSRIPWLWDLRKIKK